MYMYNTLFFFSFHRHFIQTLIISFSSKLSLSKSLGESAPLIVMILPVMPLLYVRSRLNIILQLCFTFSFLTFFYPQVRFTYRLTWEKGTGPCGIFCSPAQIGTQKLGDINSSALSSLKWMYSDGYNFSSLSGVNYHVTSVNILNTTTLAWEQGENSFDGKSVSSNRYTV